MMASSRVSRLKNRGVGSVPGSRESSPPAPQSEENNINYKKTYNLKDLDIQTTLGSIGVVT